MSSSRLLLIGSGLPHLVVLESLARNRLQAEVTLVAEEGMQAYGGMVPGYVSGRHPAEDMMVDLPRLAVAVGGRFHAGRVARIETDARTVHLEDGSVLPYDVASVALNGREPDPEHATLSHARSTGSMARTDALVAELDALAANPSPEPRRVVVIGASEEGVELALAARSRLDRAGAADVIISVLDSRSELFGGRLRAWSDLVERVLAQRDIILRLGTGVTEIGADFVRLSDGRVQPADLVLWAPGPQVQPVFRRSGLPVDAHGFLLLDDTLQVQGVAGLFGAGPGTALVAAPRAPAPDSAQRRMGRVLAHNLPAALGGTEPRRHFRARDRELTLLDAGDGRAIVLHGPIAAISRLAMRAKRLADRRFLSRLWAGGSGTVAAGAS